MSQGHAYGAVCFVCSCCDLVGASCPCYRFPLYAALYVWNMILKLLHVPGSCSCKMTPSVPAPLPNRGTDSNSLLLLWEAWWSHGVARSSLDKGLGSSPGRRHCHVSHSVFPSPRCMNGYRRFNAGGNPAMDLGGVKVLLVASCYGNRR